jgi:alkylated DNA repair dioxygenase AlkB
MIDTPSGQPSAATVRQGDLFEDLDPAVDAGFAAARRIELDGTSWLEHVPGWLRGSGRLLDELTATAPWEQRHRYMYGRRVAEPRLTAEYEDISAAPQRLLHVITATLAQHYAVAYRYLWFNLYRTHRDSTSWHGDPIGKVQETSTVPVLNPARMASFLEEKIRSLGTAACPPY